MVRSISLWKNAGVVTRLEKRFASRQKLEDVVQQIVAGSNRIVNEANPIVMQGFQMVPVSMSYLLRLR